MYATSLDQMQADTRTAVKSNVKALMVDGLADRIMHAEIVAAGEFKFRWAFGKDMGAFFTGNRSKCDDLADVVFRFFRVKWVEHYETEGMPKYDGLTPTQFLDHVEIITPPTEQEIEDAWELEIAGSESAMRTMYEGSARTRKGADLGSKKVH